MLLSLSCEDSCSSGVPPSFCGSLISAVQTETNGAFSLSYSFYDQWKHSCFSSSGESGTSCGAVQPLLISRVCCSHGWGVVRMGTGKTRGHFE